MLSPSLALTASALNGVRENLLIFDAAYGIIICKLCQYAVVPREVASHLRDLHRKEEGLTAAQIRIIQDHCLTYPAHPPTWI